AAEDDVARGRGSGPGPPGHGAARAGKDEGSAGPARGGGRLLARGGRSGVSTGEDPVPETEEAGGLRGRRQVLRRHTVGRGGAGHAGAVLPAGRTRRARAAVLPAPRQRASQRALRGPRHLVGVLVRLPAGPL